jgi:uncharacterized protein YbjT (DUF2867 family)
MTLIVLLTLTPGQAHTVIAVVGSKPPVVSLTVLVAGATGRFGDICRRLLERNHRVLALTRDPTSATGRQLAALGAQVVSGDFDDPETLRIAMAGVHAVFATGTMHRAGPDGELRHGGNIADAANAAGVGHLVWVSGAGARFGTGLSIFDIKAEVEHHLTSVDVPHTIVAPVYLMENLFNPWNLASLGAGKVRTFIRAAAKLQQVAVSDVIDFAILALEQRDRFAGQRIEIAADEPTAEEMAAALTRVAGRSFGIDQASPDDAGAGLAPLFEWLDRGGHSVDIADVRRRYPEIRWHTFQEWARHQPWRDLRPGGQA